MRLLLVAIALFACEASAGGRERIVGGPCEGCDAVFDGQPKKLVASARIAPEGEPGEPLVITGVVSDAKGKAASGVIVYAYQTDAKGIYPEAKGAKHAHGRLRGFAKTDADGTYTFTTIRPASYPNSSAPQHVHMHVVEPGRCTYFIDDVMFTDDPLLHPKQKVGLRGGKGIVTPKKEKTGWVVRRDIVLGANVPGYDACGT
jgi:protocatechuate 3,4-dioxygenase beta subunit